MCQSTFVSLCLYRDFCCLEQPWLTKPLREEIVIDCSSIMLCYWERYGMTSITHIHIFIQVLWYKLHLQIGIFIIEPIFFLYPSSWLWDWSCSMYPCSDLPCRPSPWLHAVFDRSVGVVICLRSYGEVTEKWLLFKSLWWLHNYSFNRSQAFPPTNYQWTPFLHSYLIPVLRPFPAFLCLQYRKGESLGTRLQPLEKY